MNKIKRIIYIFLFLLVLIFGLSSCNDNNKNYEDYTPQEGSIFILVESYIDPYLGNVKILVDKETRIMYIRYYESEGDGKYSGMTVLYDSKGMPKKYVGVLKDE